MPITDIIRGRTNRIVIGAVGGIGLIISSVVAISNFVHPAFRVETPDNDRVWEVTTKGAMGFGTGATPFGTLGQCLTSGGSSGALDVWGSCGTGTAGAVFGTGNVLVIGSQKYVNKQGDTMTGALLVKSNLSGSRLIVSGNANITGSLIVVGNITNRSSYSGNTLHIEKEIAASGSIITEGTLSGSVLAGFGLGDCDTAATSKLMWDVTTGKFKCGTDQTASLSGGQGITYASSVVSLSASFSGTSLTIYGTESGNRLHAEKNLTSSGTLYIVKNGYIRGTLSGNILHAEKDLSSSGTVLATGNMTSRGTISGSLLVISSSADVSGALLVKGTIASHGTLSGKTLTIMPGTTSYMLGMVAIGKTTTANSAKFDVLGTISGARLSISNNANITGNLLTVGTITTRSVLSGYTLVISRSANISGTLLVKGNLTDKSTISGSRLVVSGHTNISGNLIVLRNMSGNNLYINKTIYDSGSIITEGTLSGATFQGAGLGSCSTAASSKLMYNSSTNKFVCGTDQTSSITLSGGQGITYASNVISLSSSFSGTTIKAYALMSGALLHAEKTLSSSGTLVIVKNGFIEGTLSGNIIHSEKDLTSSGTLTIVKNGFIEGTLSGNVIHAEKVLTSSGFIMVTQKQVIGSGALTVNQQANSTGAYIFSKATKAPTLALDAATASALAPQLLFGYNGTFDVPMYRSAAAVLRIDANLIVKNSLSGARLSISNNANISGALVVVGATTFKGGTTIIGNLSGSRLIISNNANITGTLLVAGNIFNRRTYSGNILHVEKDLTSSGTLTIVSNGFLRGTFSGSVLHAEKTLTSSGTITTEGTISGSTIIGRTISGTFLKSGRYSVSPTTIELIASATGTALYVGSGRVLYVVPKTASGFRIYDATAYVVTAGASNASTVFLRNFSKGNCKVFTTPLTIDTATKNSDVSATPYVLNTNCLTVSGGDYLYVDVASISTTAPKGLNVILYIYKP